MANHPHFLWSDLFRKKSDKGCLEEVLRQNVLFQTLAPRELRYLSNLVYERIYQAEEPIFSQSSRGLGMYLIVKGRVAIKSQAHHRDEILVTILGEGSFFGELALVDPEHLRSATAVAVDRCQLVGFFQPDLMEILERKPEMGVKILFQLSTVLGRRLLETTDKMALLSRAQGMGLAAVHEERI